MVEPLLDDADLTWEEYTEATAKAMTCPTLYDVKVCIELATKIGPSAATGNWHAVEHNWERDVPTKYSKNLLNKDCPRLVGFSFYVM